ncbi:hypothetical protein B0J17DRAFT_632252 [Rhizoctonia solani]|nr:hypothetical protein B0J17DRAFT_632252 [Rhizoctonia solani]
MSPAQRSTRELSLPSDKLDLVIYKDRNRESEVDPSASIHADGRLFERTFPALQSKRFKTWRQEPKYTTRALLCSFANIREYFDHPESMKNYWKDCLEVGSWISNFESKIYEPVLQGCKRGQTTFDLLFRKRRSLVALTQDIGAICPSEYKEVPTRNLRM